MGILKAAVIGCGAIAKHGHFPCLSQHKEVDIIAACDIDEATLAHAQKEFNIPNAYTQWQELLDKEQPDILSICTPNYLHKPIAVAAAQKGINTLCEKPLATSIKDAQEIADAVNHNQIKFMVGFTHRFMNGNIKIKELLDNGTIGKPFMSRVRFAHAGPENGWSNLDWWFKKEQSGGGALMDMAVHAIDLTHWLMGPTRKVSGQVATLFKDIEVDDNAALILKNDTGIGFIDASWSSPVGVNGILIVGSEGAIEHIYGEPLRVCRGQTKADGTNEMTWQVVAQGDLLNGYVNEFNAWINYVLNDQGPVPSVPEGQAAQAVIDAAYQASDQAIQVDIPT